MRTTILACVALALAACTDVPGAERALSDAGYTSVNAGGYAAFQCGRDDNFATQFNAVGPSGRPVTGAVCRGLLKGSTVRTQ